MKIRFMEEAERLALNSPCIRRKYGVVITKDNNIISTGYNTRVGHCCENGVCVRDRYKNLNGSKIEQGAELHAEIIALFNLKNDFDSIYLAGFDNNGKILKGSACRSCYYCAMALKYKGFTYIIVRGDNGELESINIGAILEEWEQAWEELYA